MSSNNNWLDPLIVVGCLLVAHLVYQVPLSPGDAYLALVAFIFFAPPLIRSDGNRRRPAQTLVEACSSVVVRWAVLLTALLFMAFVFKVGAVFSRRVMLTWFLVTPVVLCISQAYRLRTPG